MGCYRKGVAKGAIRRKVDWFENTCPAKTVSERKQKGAIQFCALLPNAFVCSTIQFGYNLNRATVAQLNS